LATVLPLVLVSMAAVDEFQCQQTAILVYEQVGENLPKILWKKFSSL
jgi:hypothetical protein